MHFEQLEQSVWERLAQENRPIVLYGMGDGADKILHEFGKHGIQAAAVFASDEFVRGHSFRGFQVLKLSEVIARFGEDIVVVIAFATQRPEVLNKIFALDARFDVVAPDVPVVPGIVFDKEFIRTNQQSMQAAFDLMADEISREVFLDTVRFKLSGRLRYLRNSETTKADAFMHLLRPGPTEHFADLGAYTGDTIRELLYYTSGRFASITALEPDQRNFRKLCVYAEENLSGEVLLLQAGAWHSDTELTFSARAGRQSKLADQGVKTQMRALDHVLTGKKCTLLKMDVEGAEREALRGAEAIIRSCRPKLNIAVYHRSGDFFELPLLVHEVCPDYRLYLRHHPYVPAWDTNLYAVCQ
ncbi:FkbM family methyltransferase [Agathobaculum sp.]|uniref:FkbM family methyltransferase n=1 Tax=Agathobaculum sp. TaxID=2048138 RepID=UPI002A83E408|nr:FkbM family methyltransferase [Agathobaculum sp.]MDY3618957.1 FkbM family methyltransferase [Agathobaculum sp.]